MSDTSSGWSTSDDDSSGNEYSVRTRKDKLEEIEQKKTRKKSKKKKKRKKEKKSKKSKHKCEKSGSESDKEKKVYRKKTIVDISIQKDCVKDATARTKSKRRSPSRSPSKDAKRSNNRTSSPAKSKQKNIPASYRSKSPPEKDHSRSHGRSKSQSPSRSRKRSRSRNNSRSKHRSRSKIKSRSRSPSRTRNRSGSRNRIRHRSRSRNRSKSRDRDRRLSRRSPSRDHHSNRNVYSSSHRDRSRSRDRSKSRERRKSRSQDEKKRSRSTSQDGKRKSNHSLPEVKSENGTNDNDTKTKMTSAWDVRTTLPPTTPTNDTTPTNAGGKFISITSRIERMENSVDNNNETFHSSMLINTKSIEIKIPTPVPVDKSKEDPKSQVYGKWEAYQPQNDKMKPDLGKFMKMCQEISAKEGLEESPVKGGADMDVVHHPFAVKEAPLYTPPPLRSKFSNVPTNPAQAIMAGSLLSLMAPGTEPAITGPLESVYPVSSGNDHRAKYNETVTDEKAGENTLVFEEKKPDAEDINVSAVIARRLGAQQILTANPSDYSAQLVMAECDQKLKKWSDSNKKPGKFTGEVGVKMNKKAMFTVGGHQTVGKDFFHNLRPVSGGIGMKMLQNMGWKEGQPLGKSMQGFVVPISIDVKLGRTGLYAEEEISKVAQYTQQYQTPTHMGRTMQPPKKKPATIENVGGKHPVSALAEHCTKRKMGIPEYTVVSEAGASYAKLFLMKVIVETVSYQPTESSPNKKHAKAMAATVALKSMGVLTTT